MKVKSFVYSIKHINIVAILAGLFMALSFLFNGSSFLSLYHSLGQTSGIENIGYISVVVAYLIQCLGMALYGILVKKAPMLTNKPAFSCGILALEMLSVSLYMMTDDPGQGIICDLVLNFFIGMNAGDYLTALSKYVPHGIRGTVFGTASGIGSVGSWLITLMGPDNFFISKRVLIVYAAIFILNVAVVCMSAYFRAAKSEAEVGRTEVRQESSPALKISVLVLSAVIITLFGTVHEMSGYFPLTAEVNYSNTKEFARAFYAITLVAAGIINDLKRQLGGIICMVLMVMPFVFVALKGYYSNAFVILIVSYLVTGFYSVFRSISFADYASEYGNYGFIAVGGLFFGRLGEAIGFGTSEFFEDKVLALVLVNTILYIATIVLFACQQYLMGSKGLWGGTAMVKTDNEGEENRTSALEKFSANYGLSAREVEVLEQILAGKSNNEISEALFISGNTVKFHMKNILKKTECANRTELISMYERKNRVSE